MAKRGGLEGNKYAVKHGLSRTPEAAVYRHLRDRCNNPRCKDYPKYGGRGISETWGSVEAFIADVGERPSPDHQIERNDNNGDYGPGNCRWATRKEQARNRRNSRIVTHAGRSQTIAAWAEETGIGYQTIYARLAAGWEADAALGFVSRLH